MDSLTEYKRKRPPGKSPEPRGGRATKGKNSFVVQRHDATRLHYDLRLELDGVLKSWAVPKGPSLNPADKRLAVQTEDHPLDYGGFEGTIPEGNYGAGEVILWDNGTYNVEGNLSAQEQLDKGDLKFSLHGQKLNGSFVLVRIRSSNPSSNKKEWLLIKHRDAEARTDWKARLRLDGFTFIEADLHTGRTHQIRVHFSALGCPVVGDTLYGAPRQERIASTLLPPLGRNFLHAARIAFAHPRTGQQMQFRAPVAPERLVVAGRADRDGAGVQRVAWREDEQVSGPCFARVRIAPRRPWLARRFFLSARRRAGGRVAPVGGEGETVNDQAGQRQRDGQQEPGPQPAEQEKEHAECPLFSPGGRGQATTSRGPADATRSTALYSRVAELTDTAGYLPHEPTRHSGSEGSARAGREQHSEGTDRLRALPGARPLL